MLQENYLKAKILIVDDEEVVRDILSQLLRDRYDCVAVGSAEEALRRIRAEKFNLVITDINMPGISGLDMAHEIREIDSDAIVIMISGAQKVETAVEAFRVGAFDYITKPFTFEQVEAIVTRALDHQMRCATKKRYENRLEVLVDARTAELHDQIIERRRAEKKVSRMAYYDALTELPNPTFFRNRLTHELSSSEGDQKSAVVLLALDRFENINDTLGHTIGDELLRGVAQRLTNTLRPTDMAAYFGGAEFALLLPKVGGAEDTAQITQNIKKAFLKPFDCGDQQIFVTASLGISLSPDDGKDCQKLLQNAGAALCSARQSGDTCRFFTSEMHAKAFNRLTLETDLRKAIERDEFVVYYQPQINLPIGRFSGMEALVRWQHPIFGLVPPNDFIPIAEETGLILPLGEQVLRKACRQNAEWQRAGLAMLSVSVNLSLRQFQQDNLVETINQILSESGLDPQYLELEVTESSIMNDTKQAIEILHLLKSSGIKISLDDFGMGYSSLSLLKALPLDVLKIDRVFVQNITTDPKDEAIVKTIVTLAHNLKLKIIVEGVETAEQSAALYALGCQDMQGYYYSKPVSADSLEILLRTQQTSSASGVQTI